MVDYCTQNSDLTCTSWSVSPTSRHRENQLVGYSSDRAAHSADSYSSRRDWTTRCSWNARGELELEWNATAAAAVVVDLDWAILSLDCCFCILLWKSLTVCWECWLAKMRPKDSVFAGREEDSTANMYINGLYTMRFQIGWRFEYLHATQL